MTNFPILYTRTKTGKIQEWIVTTSGDEIHVTFGQQDGKKNTKITKATAKNVGRANETTPSEQAVLEAESKWKKQLRTGYATSIEDLEQESRLPMLAGDYSKVGHRISFPCHVSRKLDGLRCVAVVNDDNSVTLLSRGGKEYDVQHLHAQILELSQQSGHKVFDGELYIHGVPLQTITSLAKKPKPESEQLKYVIFDIPSEEEWYSRYMDLAICGVHIDENSLDNLDTVKNELAESEEQAREIMNKYLQEGYEGLMLRNFNGRYLWGTRNGDLQKWKIFQDLEAKVISAIEDKNGEGVLTCKMQNGNLFECKMIGDHNYRKISNMLTLINKYVTVKYQALTLDGKPSFPVGMCVRDCDSNGNPLV